MKSHVPGQANIIFRAYDLNEHSIDDSNRRTESYVMARQPDAEFGYFNTNQFALTSSNNFTGNQSITGSLNISGSFYLNNTLITITSGTISASLTDLTPLNQFTQSQYISNSYFATTGSNTFVGTQTITGSIDLIGNKTITGSISISGSKVIIGNTSVIGNTTTLGNSTLTGSFLVSGSTTQIGNNTLTGTTTLSGSIFMNGNITPGLTQTFSLGTSDLRWKDVFFGSASIYIQDSIIGNPDIELAAFNGSLLINNRLEVSQSFTASLQEGYVWVGNGGNKSISIPSSSFVKTTEFNRYTSSISYGSFSDTTTQSGSQNTAHAIKHNTTDIANGISVVSGSKITVSQTGVYEIITSQQYTKNSAGTDEITVWLSYTGSNVANTGTDLVLKGNSSRDLFVCNYMIPMISGSYCELYWSATANDTTVLAVTERINPIRPSIPSVITTIKKIG